MSLQTGSRLAVTKYPLIDPSNLKIVAYEVEGPLLSERPSFLRIADVREFSRIGMIIDSSDEFIGLNDVIAVKKLHDLNFDLIGMQVVDENHRKLGKVENFTVDTNSFIIQQLDIKRSFIKNITDTGLLIHRSQILEINNQHIVVRSAAKKLEPIAETKKVSYINPFRPAVSQQTD